MELMLLLFVRLYEPLLIQNVAHRTAASAPFRSLLAMSTLRPHPDLENRSLYLNKNPKCFMYKRKPEKLLSGQCFPSNFLNPWDSVGSMSTGPPDLSFLRFVIMGQYSFQSFHSLLKYLSHKGTATDIPKANKALESNCCLIHDKYILVDYG